MADSSKKTIYTPTPLCAPYGTELHECAVNMIGPCSLLSSPHVKQQKAESCLPQSRGETRLQEAGCSEPSWEMKVGGVTGATGWEQKTEAQLWEQSQGVGLDQEQEEKPMMLDL
ncbi:uncharacterized protein V6R79_000144 [Siganus canaliculatus]